MVFARGMNGRLDCGFVSHDVLAASSAITRRRREFVHLKTPEFAARVDSDCCVALGGKLRCKFHFYTVYQVQDHDDQNKHGNYKDGCQWPGVTRALHCECE